MFEKTEELIRCPGLTQLLDWCGLPRQWVESLQLLTQASQSGTYIWRIWHFMSVQLGGKAKNNRRTGRLDLGFRWGELPSLLLVLESGRLVGAVTKRLVRGVPATAESDRGASTETVCLTLHVDELDLPFDTQRAITTNDDLG